MSTTVLVKPRGYDPDGRRKPDVPVEIDPDFGYIEITTAAGLTYRIQPNADKHGLDGIEIMQPDGRGLAVRPIVSNVVVVQAVGR